MNIQFRKMTTADIHTVWELECKCFSCPWSENSLREEMRNKIAYYELMESDGELIGYAGIWVLFGEAHITNVAIAPEYRGRGLGRTLMLHMFEKAKARRARAMTLEVREHNEAAKAMYYHLGFKQVGERKRYYSDTGESALILWNYNIAAAIDTARAKC